MKLVRLLNKLNTSKLLREAVEMFGDVPVLVNPDANEVQALLDSVLPTRIKVDLKGLWDPRGKVYIWDGGDEVNTSRHHITITLGIIERYGHPDENDFYDAFGDDVEDRFIKSFEDDGMLIPSIIEYRKMWPGQQWTGQKYTAPPENPLSVTNPYNVWTASDIILKTPEMIRAFGGPLKESVLLHEFDVGDFQRGGDDGDKSYETPYIEHYKKSLVMKLWKGSWTFAANPKGAEMMGSAIAAAGFYFSNNIEFAPGVSQELRNRVEFGWGEHLEDKNHKVWGLDDRPVDREERYQLIFGNKPGATPDWEGMSGVRNGS